MRILQALWLIFRLLGKRVGLIGYFIGWPALLLTDSFVDSVDVASATEVDCEDGLWGDVSSSTAGGVVSSIMGLWRGASDPGATAFTELTMYLCSPRQAIVPR